MDAKYKILIGAVVVVSSFAVGRYTTPVKIKTETKIVEVVKVVKDIDVNQKKTTKIITKPDGSKEETTVTETERHQKDVIDDKTNTDSKLAESKGGDSKLSIYGIVGIDFNLYTPVYGLGISKQLIGPFNLGIFGLTNKTAGVTLGLSF